MLRARCSDFQMRYRVAGAMRFDLPPGANAPSWVRLRAECPESGEYAEFRTRCTLACQCGFWRD
jgi:hypothetical protein